MAGRFFLILTCLFSSKGKRNIKRAKPFQKNLRVAYSSGAKIRNELVIILATKFKAKRIKIQEYRFYVFKFYFKKMRAEKIEF